MSLRVWLPLNGDLRNQGLNNISVTNSNVSIDNNGKLGKCYRFETSGSYLEIPKEAMTSFETQCSMCFWFKILSWNTTYATFVQAGLGGAPWSNYIFGFLRYGSSSKCCFSISNGSSYISGNCLSTINFQLNTWYHISLIYKTGHCLIYINGQLNQDYSTSVVPDYSKITTITLGKSNTKASYQSNCLMNDFRIYDHALSEFEIKRISQGLILHYPLDNRGLGNVNLAYNTKNLSPGASSQVEYKAYKVGLLDVTDGETITISFDLDMTINTANNYLLVYNSNKKGPHRIQSVLALPNESVSVGDHIQKRVSVVTTISDRTTGVTEIEDWIEFYSNYDTENEIIINNIKVERGDKATTWSPSPFDDLYTTTLQLNDTSVKDISGFNNNANYNNLNGVDFAQVGQALVGTSHNFTFNIDTPIYEVGTNFNHIDNYIIGQSPSLQGRTVTCWIKFKECDNQVVFIDYKSGCSFGIYNTYVPVACKSISYHQCYNKDIFVANIWYFIAVVRDDDNEKVDLYVNGEKQTPVSSTDYWSSNVSDKLTIGARTNGTTLFNGVMSDFRIYATKLSEDDIKELYEYRS